MDTIVRSVLRGQEGLGCFIGCDGSKSSRHRPHGEVFDHWFNVCTFLVLLMLCRVCNVYCRSQGNTPLTMRRNYYNCMSREDVNDVEVSASHSFFFLVFFSSSLSSRPPTLSTLRTWQRLPSPSRMLQLRAHLINRHTVRRTLQATTTEMLLPRLITASLWAHPGPSKELSTACSSMTSLDAVVSHAIQYAFFLGESITKFRWRQTRCRGKTLLLLVALFTFMSSWADTYPKLLVTAKVTIRCFVPIWSLVEVQLASQEVCP